MIALLSLLSIAGSRELHLPKMGCSDVFFLEKNQISNYVRYSKSHGVTHISTPALNFALDLEKNGFGKMIYDSDLLYRSYGRGILEETTTAIMLYGYKSSKNLHIYRICSKGMDESLMVGPFLSDAEKFHLIGYKINITDINRLNKHLADKDFKLFGNDANALRAELAIERMDRHKNELLERVRARAEEWEKKSFISKVFNYWWMMLTVLFIISLFR